MVNMADGSYLLLAMVDRSTVFRLLGLLVSNTVTERRRQT